MVLSDQNFKAEVLQSALPVLVDFYADWCAPCLMVAPIVEEIAKEYGGKIKVGRLDVDKNQQTAQRYGVMGIPTLILFRDGKESKKIVGLRSKENLVEELGLK